MKLKYETSDIQKAINALNGMTVTGVENARRLVLAAGILLKDGMPEDARDSEEKEGTEGK